MHGGALVFMVTFWGLVLGLAVFVFCRLYCPNVDLNKTAIGTSCEPKTPSVEEIDEVT
jgi:hypothetical protein